MKHGRLRGCLLSSAVVLGLLGCSSSSSNNGADAGTGGNAEPTSNGGNSGSGGAGTSGSAGQSNTGGSTGTGGESNTAGGGSGSGGESGGSGGTAGETATGGGGQAGAENAGAGGEAGAAGSGGNTGPHGSSAGCMMDAPAEDSDANYVKHMVTVTGVDPAFIAAHPPNSGSWTERNYYVRLPANYDSTRPYPVIFGGGGCGNTDGTSGSGGGFGVLSGGQSDAILIGMSYIFPQGAGACFADGFSNTPDVPYFDSMLADIEAHYCVDKAKIFVAGYSSGAWESYTLGFARGGVIRGIATAAGGLRMDRPPSSNMPFAAILLTGAGDGENPITGPTGSAAARDQVLMQNGCVGTDTVDWPTFANGACKQYTGCPAAYPVIFCTPPGQHTDGGGDYKTAIWSFWSSLP